MESESALVTEDIKRFAPRVLGGGRVVFALVQKGTGLLAFECVVVETHPVHGEDGVVSLALDQAGGQGSELLQFPHPGIDPFDNGGGFELLIEFGRNYLTHRLPIDCLGKYLQREQVVIAIDDQPGQKVRLAENDSIRVAISHHPRTIGDRCLQAFAQQAGQVSHRPGRNHADGNLRGAAIERRAQALATLISYLDQGPGSHAVRGDDVGTVDPDVAFFQTGGAAAGNSHR